MRFKRINILLAVAFASLAFLATPATAQAHEWPTWGNGQIADCSFAAAANWELAALGHLANEAQVEREFAEAGCSSEEGISEQRFHSWWQHHGIGGIKATVRE